MVKIIINFISREIKGLHEAAYLLAIFAFLSQILALVRDRLLAGTFGASEIVDVYYASFRIPDLLFVIVTALVSAAVLVPIFSKEKSEYKDFKKTIDSLFTVFITISIVVIVIVFIFVKPLLSIFVPDLLAGPYQQDLILFTRILLLSPFLLGISQLFGGIVQAYRRFFIYAISPILYNIGIIIGIAYLYPKFGSVGLVAGVVLGLVMHVLVQLPMIINRKLLPNFTTKIDWQIVKKVLSLSLPRAVTLASSQITLIVLISIASTITAGSIAIFNFAYNLQSVPLAIIGVSYSLAAFPTLSKLFAENKKEEFLANLITAIRHIIFWSLPVIVMFIVLRAQIVRVILGSGSFDWSDTRLTAAALALFAISVIAQSLILIFVRGYYSAGQTRKPLFINIFSVAVTIFLAYLLTNLYSASYTFKSFFEILLRVDGLEGTVVLMLPLAFSIGMILNASILWYFFEKSFGGFSKIVSKTAIQSFFASLTAGVVAYYLLSFFDDMFDLETLAGIFLQGFLSGVIGLAAGLLILIMFKNYEIGEVWRTVHHKFWKARAIAPGQDEL
jgi:putative peptidoglycan lipid II flippase